LRQVTEGTVFPPAILAIQHQHARGGAISQWLLRNGGLGQVVVELGYVHSILTITM